MAPERIGREEYAAAVAALVKLARQPTSGGRAAAQVLLSAYNGFDFQVDIAGLGSLDHRNYELAMTVIRGRFDTGCEPHQLISGGEGIFADLWTQWQSLHVEERGKVECPLCEGRGEVWPVSEDGGPAAASKPCSRCDGKGKVCRCGR